MKTLVLSILGDGMPGLTPAKGRVLAEACSVCLAGMEHQEHVALQIVGDYATCFKVARLSMTDPMRAGYRFDTRTTDDGACAIGILVVADLTDYEVVEEAARGSYFDYWLARKGSFLFQDSARLEVSGLRDATEAQIATRVREKTSQIDRSPHCALPGFVVVVEFSRPLARVIRR